MDMKAYKRCRCVLWTASTPVVCQQERHWDVRCPKGFLHGTYDTWYFGGHDRIREVATGMEAAWWEYAGGHSNTPVPAIDLALKALLGAHSGGLACRCRILVVGSV